MRDRISQFPGRVKLTKIEGSEDLYTMQRYDSPTDPGTPLNKATFLKDQTEAALFGSANDRTVDDAFYGISVIMKLIMQNFASISVTVKDSSGIPVSGAQVNGIADEDGNAVFTNSSGLASGYVGDGEQTISVTGYADLQDTFLTFDAIKGNQYEKTLTMNRVNFLEISSTKTYEFSSAVDFIDVTVVGAGGGGNSGRIDSYYAYGGNGGKGGRCVVSRVTPEKGKKYVAVIGAGGEPGKGKTGYAPIATALGGNGGSSSFMGITATGGTGGNGGSGASAYLGNGVSGSDGKDGTESGYVSFDDQALFGASGGGGAAVINTNAAPTGGSGGEPGGGKGGGWEMSVKNPSAGEDKTGSGGGGGYADADDDDRGIFGTAGDGAPGGSGYISVRITFK